MGADRAADLAALSEPLRTHLDAANRAREIALPACRAAIRACSSSIRAVHALDFDRATELADQADRSIREAQEAVRDYPEVAQAGFLHDAEKELVEARVVAALVSGSALPSAAELGVGPAAWLRGVAEAASELRRHTLDRLRDGDLKRGEDLLSMMDGAYEVLVGFDYPDALTSGLRRTLDALRAVLERTRGDVTTTILQTRLQRALEAASPDASP